MSAHLLCYCTLARLPARAIDRTKKFNKITTIGKQITISICAMRPMQDSPCELHAIRKPGATGSPPTSMGANTLTDLANTAFWSICNFAVVFPRMDNAHQREWQSIRLGSNGDINKPTPRLDSSTMLSIPGLSYVVDSGITKPKSSKDSKNIVFDQKYAKRGATPEDVQFECALPSTAESGADMGFDGPSGRPPPRVALYHRSLAEGKWRLCGITTMTSSLHKHTRFSPTRQSPSPSSAEGPW
ncbi:hypothetical protein F4780DRAFT_783400 [Xylariomycetidae sp. FL0641]|nr:hypothetical protein F4780DRAFT_784929 [Xylariomycetidae sp. FL0641]KAI0016263.1 hypothetical protein F4780DRAFT_783400 [Xylariomycetidae sp. FL0641]